MTTTIERIFIVFKTPYPSKKSPSLLVYAWDTWDENVRSILSKLPEEEIQLIPVYFCSGIEF
jgi:hypothetical protein